MPDATATPAPSAEALAIESGCAYVRRRSGAGYELLSISYQIVGPDGVQQTLSLNVVGYLCEQARKRVLQAARGEAPPVQPEIARGILDVLRAAEKPLKGRTVAGRCKREFTSHFRTILSGLVKSGQVVLLPGGYWLAERDRPEDLSGPNRHDGQTR